MKFLIGPASNPVAKKNYEKTIERTWSIKSLEHLGEMKLSDFSDKEMEYSVWGITNNNEKKGMLDNLDKDSYFIFYRDHRLFSYFNIVKTFKSIKLNEKLWGNKGDWENIILLKKINDINIDIKNFNKTMNYKKDNVIQGLSKYENEKYDKINKLIKDYMNEYKQEIKQIANKSFGKELDIEYLRKIRTEQQKIRNILIKNNQFNNCVLCSKNIDKLFMAAAHIKKREFCSDQEKRDILNIAAPMCKFGCDALYEEGYVVVDEEGYIRKNKFFLDKILSEKENSYINQLINKKVLNFNDSNKKYYKDHYVYHQK